VALSGQHAPGIPGGVAFTSLGAPSLDATGKTAFVAGLAGIGQRSGIWSETNGPLQLVAWIGDTPPGVPAGVSYQDFQGPSLRSAGRIAFRGVLTGSGVTSDNDSGIWSNKTGTLSLVVREGSEAPGTPPGTVFNFASLSTFFNSAGELAFRSRLEGSSPVAGNDGIWVERGGAILLVALEGDHAPGTPIGANFANFELPVLNTSGRTAFGASLSGNVTTNDNSGIWSDKNGPLELIVRQGDAAPGLPPGVNFAGDFPPMIALNDAGHLAFSACLSGSGFNSCQSVWSDRTGPLQLITRAGDPAPGAPAGFEFVSDFGRIVMNSDGNVAFQGFASENPFLTRSHGIWSEGQGSLALVAMQGQHAAGAPANVRFDSFSDPVLNSNGQVAFQAGVNLTGVPRSNHVGIWAEDPYGVLQLIAREGDLWEVGAGDFRTINSVILGGFNDLGQVSFYALFTDGSEGVFVSNLAAVPEPSALLLAGLSVGALMLIRTRCRSRSIVHQLF
jgi:hypothetical protein